MAHTIRTERCNFQAICIKTMIISKINLSLPYRARTARVTQLEPLQQQLQQKRTVHNVNA